MLIAAIPVAAALLLSNAGELPAQMPARALTKVQLQKKYLLSQITKEDMAILLKDASPPLLKRMSDDPAYRERQIQSIRELLAISNQAVKDGYATPETIEQFENIRIESTARSYDKEILKNTGAPFSGVTKAQITAFYAKPGNTAKFDRYLKLQFDLLKQREPDRKYPSEPEIAEVKDYFAKTRIYDAASRLRAPKLGLKYTRELNLNIAMQRMQYISRIYFDKVLDAKMKVEESEVSAYIQAHPEFFTKQKEKATQILARARAGEDFAKLANEFTEDPGNGGEDGTKQGGIYRNVKKGVMIPAFEQAALAMNDGQVSPDLTQTIYGYHIIKLENKRHTKGEDGVSSYVYDVRHILISTDVRDPENPSAPSQTLSAMVRSKLEREKEKREMGLITKNNPVVVAKDFVVPVVTDEQVKASGTGSGIGVGSANTTVSDDEPPPPPPPTPRPTPAPPQTNVLPAKVRADLNKVYVGWKSAPGSRFCSAEYRKSFVSADFNGDGRTDYAVKIAVRRKGYLVAYIADETGYKSYPLNNMSATEAGNSALGIFKKGGKWPLGEPGEPGSLELTVDNDAVFFGPCASDNTGLYIFKDGKFTGI